MIVITGATGKVGSKLVQKLLAKGKIVKALGRNQEKLLQLQRLGAYIENLEPNDADGLSKAFKDAEAVFLILPPNFQAVDIGVFHNQVSKAQIKAIEKAGVKKAVFLSSQGTPNFETSDIVAGVARHERELNKLQNTDVLCLRPTYFMENLLPLIPMIDALGVISTPIKSTTSFGLIATEDVAETAAAKLSDLDFVGKSYLDLLGDRDYNHLELATIMGKVFGKPELQYLEISYDDNKAALLNYGISPSMADYFNILYKGINSGEFITGKRSADTTTSTTFESFTTAILKN